MSTWNSLTPRRVLLPEGRVVQSAIHEHPRHADVPDVSTTKAMPAAATVEGRALEAFIAVSR
jgi:hypothetical protein